MLLHSSNGVISLAIWGRMQTRLRSRLTYKSHRSGRSLVVSDARLHLRVDCKQANFLRKRQIMN